MKLSIPSLSEIFNQVSSTVKRFPFVISAAVLLAISSISLIEIQDDFNDELSWLTEFIFFASLGISVFLATTTLAESLSLSSAKKLLLRGVALLFLIVYYFLSGENISSGPDMYGYRFSLIVLASHLFVSFSPFIKNANINEFWGYNKTLLLELFKSAVYSAILFAGLSIALLSLDALFGIDIKELRYFQLWIFIVSVFNTVFFLSNVPKPGAFNPQVTQYPAALKSMVQYVLIPLVSVYILILYSYSAKILLQWELPTGWVANLVLSFSIAGILSLLLLHPIKNEAKNNWIKIYSKGYYLALIPLILLLFISIGTRISEYGVTINRYFVATLAVWLAGIVLYFVLSKSKNIKVIPISLCVMVLCITFGPFSAFSISERSQSKRLNYFLDYADLLNDHGKIKESTHEFSFADSRELSSIIRYLSNNHGPEVFSDYFDFDITQKLDSLSNSDEIYINKPEEIARLMGVDYTESYVTQESQLNSFYNFTTNNLTATNVAAYRVFLDDIFFNTFNTSTKIKSDENEWVVSLVDEQISIHQLNNDYQLDISLSSLISNLTDDYGTVTKQIPIQKMLINHENQHLKVLLRIVNLTGEIEQGSTDRLTSIQFQLFISDK